MCTTQLPADFEIAWSLLYGAVEQLHCNYLSLIITSLPCTVHALTCIIVVSPQMVEASVRFKSELGRHTYVTPTSYLELITLFQQLLAQKRAENEKAFSRYSTGLQKLQSSSEQVAVMQIELRVSISTLCSLHFKSELYTAAGL